MKKPIDPNLDNILDDELLNADNEKAQGEIKEPNEAETENHIYLTREAPSSNNCNDDVEMKIETVDKSLQRHSHRHHNHHSSEEHSHGNSNTHSSHHHSSAHSHSHSHGHSHSHSHGHSQKKKSKMSTAAKIAVSVLIVFLILVLAVVFAVVYLESSGKNDFKDTAKQTDYQEVIEYNGDSYVYNEDVVAIAFIGVDKRELGLDNGVVGTAGQADADVVMTINTKTGRAKAIAVPRDTMVDVDLYSESGIFLRSENMQLCLSYAYGDGKTTSAKNVTTSLSRILCDVPINKYFALDLDGIAPINDAIGGVTVTSLYDFHNLGISQGDTVHLEGDLTESYVRQRNTDTVNASLNRTARQVQYIKAFAAQLLPAVTKDFSIITKLYNTASDYSTTDISLSNATYLASFLLSKGITDFETVTLEGEMKASEKEDYGDYVYAEFYPDEDKLTQTVLDTFYIKQEKQN